MKGRKKGGARRLLHLLWIIPLLIVLLFGTLMYLVPALENVDRTPVEGAADWMKGLPDDMPLSDVVLPGTHDAATKNVQLAFITRCQALTIAEQLDAGFRYLDIRLAASGEKLKLMHGFTACLKSGWPWASTLFYDDVLSDSYAFLKAHPTETIVFAVKHEYGSETPEQLEALLSAYIAQDPDMWLLTDSIPTVGEARGKIVLVRHYEDKNQPVPTVGLPCYWQTQNGHNDVSLNAATHKNGSYTLIIQDRYEYDPADKLNAFRSGVAAGQTGETFLTINFLSTKGTAAFGHPYGLAKKLNPALLGSNDALKGWIVTDFGSAKLAQRIYQTNFAG